MEYRTVSGTDLKLSVITFGTISFAGTPKSRPRDTEEGKRAMRLALDMGVNTIHSSYEYETWYAVREVLAERKDAKSLKHIVKIPNPDMDKTDFKYASAYFRKLVEEALAGLNAERIDLVQWPLRDDTECDPKLAVEHYRAYKDDLLADFEKLRDEGKVRYLSTFAYTNAYAQEIIAGGAIKTLLFYYSLTDTTLQPSLEQIEQKGLSAIAFRPFHGGALVNKRADRNALPEGDRWKRDWGQKVLTQRDQLFEAVGLKPDNLTAMAIKFCLTSPCVASLITGLNTREQVKEVLGAADGKYLDPALGRKLYEAAGQLGIRRECNR